MKIDLSLALSTTNASSSMALGPQNIGNNVRTYKVICKVTIHISIILYSKQNKYCLIYFYLTHWQHYWSRPWSPTHLLALTLSCSTKIVNYKHLVLLTCFISKLSPLGNIKSASARETNRQQISRDTIFTIVGAGSWVLGVGFANDVLMYLVPLILIVTSGERRQLGKDC